MAVKTLYVHNDYALLNIAHNFTAMQQKLWHYMLLFAAKELRRSVEHKISLARLVNYLNVKSTYEIRDKILAMGKCENDDIFSYYFERISIVDDTVFYAYPQHLRLLLAHPSVWAATQKFVNAQFQSKYSLFLYEFFYYYDLFCANHAVPLQAFRHFLGLAPYQYPDIKTLHRSIITQAICEINNKTPLIVSLKYDKEGAVVVGFKVAIMKKKVSLEEVADHAVEQTHKEKHHLFLHNAACARYYRMPKPTREKIDMLYAPWIEDKKQQKNSGEIVGNENITFLVDQCLAPYEQNFEVWAQHVEAVSAI